LAVDESDIGQVKVGQVVSFSADAFPDRQFKGVVDQVRLSATTTSNVVTYPVVVTVDNGDGTLLPGLTVNAEIEVSKRAGVLKVANAALRYKPADTGATAQQAPQGMRGGGGSIGDDLERSAQALKLTASQQAALQQALDDMRERQAAREASAQNGQQGGNRLFGGGGGAGGPRMVVMGGGGNSGMQAQIRQRMRERMQQQFAAFRASLDDSQRAQWDAAVDGLLNAKRAPVYKLVDAKPEMAMVRIGASDGTATEISGNIKEGDVLVVGERAAESK
ncbi:MAG TPA: HlyD family efflux transporter periplasmic adaptor subunit, partial [Thermomonas sp.]|nr:HlyD family efflux transporter periplasmic adaptor subunit [Thermomonas sp.]